MDPLKLEFSVGCLPEHAFELWAKRTSLWWPSAHSVSGDPELKVTFEPRPGGRIYERAADGAEHDWGEVLAWEPPRRLGARGQDLRERNKKGWGGLVPHFERACAAA